MISVTMVYGATLLALRGAYTDMLYRLYELGIISYVCTLILNAIHIHVRFVLYSLTKNLAGINT